MRTGRSCWVLLLLLLTVALLSPISAEKDAVAGAAATSDDSSRTQQKISTSLRLTDEDGKNRTDKAMKVPGKQTTGEVISIKRSVSPPQKLTTLISKRVSDDTNHTTTSPPREEAVRSLAGVSGRVNVSRELMLPISMDIAKIVTGDSAEDSDEEDDAGMAEGMAEALPEAQELRLVRPQERRRLPHIKPPRPIRPPPNRRNVYTGAPRTPVIRPSKRQSDGPKRRPTESECTFFTKTVCLETTDYPHEAITRSLRTNKEMVTALLTDYKAQDYGSTEEKLPIPLPFVESKFENRYENRYENNEIKRRSDNPFDNVEEGFTCPSTVKYARPQLARAASGVWKYIINTGEHTQTLRLEKCSNPQSSCSFISENYRSSCVQIYNYHRLLTWDQKLGLHMDIFKVPTCCSCHVHGYSEIFPPHQKDPPTKPRESFPGADFATTPGHKDLFQDLGKPTINHIKFNAGPTLDSSLGSSNKKPVLDLNPSSRPSFTLPGRRTKKPASIPRPYDKLPQQHAPNTRAPGYKGPLTKGNRLNRLSRPPYRRESTAHVEDYTEAPANSSVNNRYSQPYDQDVDATSRLQHGGFDDEYQEPQKRVNYNYHPIIDFFQPEASMLKAEPQRGAVAQPAAVQSDSSAWKPMIS